MKDLFGRTLTKSATPYISTDDIGNELHTEDIYEWAEDDVWEINEETPMIDNLKNFRIPLFGYQLASIHVMHMMETYKCINTKTRDIFSSAFVLSSFMGSGKSSIILGLIEHSPIPTSGPLYPIAINFHTFGKTLNGYPRGLLTRRYKTICRPTLIFVGYGVLNQWCAEVNKFTRGKRVFVIDGISALKQFYEIVNCKDINKYDIIIIKNKDVTGTWVWKHDEIEESIIDKSAKKIYNMVAVMCRNLCFARLVVDDFDTIGVPPIAGNINALATWLISSTKAEITSRKWANTEHHTLEGCIHHNNIGFAAITKNLVLYSLFNVHVSREYVDKFITAGCPQYFYYKFINSAGKVMDLINCMAGDKISEIMEALNGDAVGEAAKLAGIEANDPNQIFKALLQKNYDRLAEAKTILSHFEEYFDKLDIDAIPPFSACPNKQDTYTKGDLRNGRPVEWRYPGIRVMINEERIKWQTQFDECADCMSKFKASVQSNECTVCSLELDDPDENYAIMPCCNEIIHADCAVRGCVFQKEHTLNGVIIAGRCPFDKSHKVLWKNVTYIKGGFDLTQIDESKILDQIDSVPDDAIPIIKKTRQRSKYTAILDIVNGVLPVEQKQVYLRIPSVMHGKVNLPNPDYIESGQKIRSDMANFGISQIVSNELMLRLFPSMTPRVLIFSNFDESISRIEETLNAICVNYVRLGGTMTQMSDQISMFNTQQVNVMIIKSTTHCSSLNLQMATDLIFAHQIKDSHIMRQVIGRIQRTGRVFNARIHWMLFANEVSSLDEYACK